MNTMMISFWPEATTLLAWLVTFLLHSTLLLGGAWLVTRVLETPRLREFVWRAALVGSLVTATLQVGYGAAIGGPLTIDTAQLAQWADRGTDVLEADAEPGAPNVIGAPDVIGDGAQGEALGLDLGDAAPATGATAPFDGSRQARTPDAAAAGSTQDAGAPLLTMQGLALLACGAWFLWAAAGLVHLFARRRRVAALLAGRRRLRVGPLVDELRQQQRANGPRRRVRLTASERVASPLAIGLGEICLPSYAARELDRDSHAAMLAHELAHLRRMDAAWSTFAAVLVRAFPFQPLLRIAARRMRAEAELCCDADAVRATGDANALARCLLAVAERTAQPNVPAWAAAMAASRSELVTRVESALDGGARAPRRGRVAMTGAASVLALGLVACAGPGVCRCAETGMFGLLSADGTEPGRAVVIERVDTGSAHGLLETEVEFLSREPEAPRQPVHVFIVQEPPPAELAEKIEPVEWVDHAEPIEPVEMQEPADPESVTIGEFFEGSVRDAEPSPQALGYAGGSDPEVEALSGLGYLGASDPEVEPAKATIVDPRMVDGLQAEELAALSSFGYSMVSLDVEPDIEVHLRADGSVWAGNHQLVTPGTKDFSRVEAFLAEAVKRMPTAVDPAKPGLPALPDGVLRIRSDHGAPFSSVQGVMEQCGKKDVLIWRLQLDVEVADGRREVIPYALPRDVGVIATKLPPRFEVTIMGDAVALEVPADLGFKSGGEDRILTAEKLEGYAKKLHERFPDGSFLIDAHPGTTFQQVTPVLDAIIRAGATDIGFLGRRQ